MPPTPTLSLPKDLLAATQKVPDFQAKLEQFARTEVALHQFRKGRYQPKSLHILAKAKQAVAGKELRGKDRVSQVAKFLKNYRGLVVKR